MKVQSSHHILNFAYQSIIITTKFQTGNPQGAIGIINYWRNFNESATLIEQGILHLQMIFEATSYYQLNLINTKPQTIN